MKLGWLPVLQLDGRNWSAWVDVGQAMEKCGQKEHKYEDWSRKAVVATNQKFFILKKTLVETLKQATCIEDMLRCVSSYRLPRQKRINTEIKGLDEKWSVRSTAYSFNLESLVNFEMPKCLTVTKWMVFSVLGNGLRLLILKREGMTALHMCQWAKFYVYCLPGSSLLTAEIHIHVNGSNWKLFCKATDTCHEKTYCVSRV